MNHVNTGESSKSLSKIAYLGPEGTYGQQAAKIFAGYLPFEAELVACPTISDVYHNPSTYLVLPFHNTIHGVVTETLNLLLSILNEIKHVELIKEELQDRYHDILTPDSNFSHSITKESRPNHHDSPKIYGNRPRIIAEFRMPIRHCLVARKGVKLDDIRIVRSHEQALGQSKSFLSTKLPQATIQPVSSTAAAAQSILESSPSDERPVAAICSKAVLEEYTELELLYEGTQDQDHNYTRFFFLTRDPSQTPISNHISSSSDHSRTVLHFFIDAQNPESSTDDLPFIINGKNQPNGSFESNGIDHSLAMSTIAINGIYIHPSSSTTVGYRDQGLLEILSEAGDQTMDLRQKYHQVPNEVVSNTRDVKGRSVPNGSHDISAEHDIHTDKRPLEWRRGIVYIGSALMTSEN